MSSRLWAALYRVKQLPYCPVDGAPKQRGHCFCKSCYFALPVSMRSSLFISLAEAPHESSENYALAIRHLAKLGFYVIRHKLPDHIQRALRDSDLTGAWKLSKFARVRSSQRDF